MCTFGESRVSERDFTSPPSAGTAPERSCGEQHRPCLGCVKMEPDGDLTPPSPSPSPPPISSSASRIETRISRMSRVYVSPAMCGTCPCGGSRPARLPRPLTTQRRGPAGLRGGARSPPDRQRVTGKGFQPRPCPTPAPATPAAVPSGRGRGALRSLLCAAVRGCLILPGAASSYPLWPVRVSPSTGVSAFGAGSLAVAPC